jgi:hypothetical protein
MFAAAAVLASACREAADRTGTIEEGVYTVQQLQDYRDPAHPRVGDGVKVRGVVVTAVDDFDEDAGGHVGSIWVSEVDPSATAVCGPWCGITVYAPTIVPEGDTLRLGDIVSMTGTYGEFLYEDDGTPPDPADPFPWHFEHLSEVNEGTVSRTGEWLPVAPYEASAQEVQMEPVSLQAREAAESLEGVLVTVRNLTASKDYDTHGQFETAEGVMIEDDLFHYPCPGYSGDVTGTHFDSVTGVVTWFGMKNAFADYKILPRGPEDFSPVPDPSLCAP